MRNLFGAIALYFLFLGVVLLLIAGYCAIPDDAKLILLAIAMVAFFGLLFVIVPIGCIKESLDKKDAE